MAADIPVERRLQVKARDLYRCAVCKVMTYAGAWHHRRTRSVRDEHTHCSCNGVWVCHQDHRRIHDQPFTSRASGLIVTRHDHVGATERKMPFEFPVNLKQFGWVLLDCEGGYTLLPDPPQ